MTDGKIHFWTIQKPEVINIVMREGTFLADFSKSAYLETIPDWDLLYEWLLKAYNIINKTDFNGLVFGFMRMVDEQVKDIEDLEEFLETVYDGKDALRSMWNYFKMKNCKIVHLETERKYNPMGIDLNNFQVLMPPMLILPPFTEDYVSWMMKTFFSGVAPHSIFPGNIMQVHIPQINREDIVQVYDF